MASADDVSSIDALLARATFGPYPGQASALLAAHGDRDGVIDHLLATVLPFDPVLPAEGGEGEVRVPIDEKDTTDLYFYQKFRPWWLGRMLRDDAGVHERMMWFWHSHLTSSFVKVDSTNLCWRQLRTLHEHAMGDVRSLLRAVTVDGAMLRYLDGDGSKSEGPNENYARELMELFTIGLGEFTQDDVTAAARLLSGWRLVVPELSVEFDPGVGPTAAETVLGRRGCRTVDDLIDAVLAHDSCAPFLVTALWELFIGGEADADLVSRWADELRSTDYAIAPTVAAILRSDALAATAGRRPRTPLEWACGAARAAGTTSPDLKVTELGQSPYLPPSVAGWPPGVAWLTSSQMRARAAFLAATDMPAAVELAAAPDLVAAVLDRCSVPRPSAATRAALDQLAADPGIEGPTGAAQVLAAALLSPEVALR